eukprot:3457032-Alexandrium_andersonii.AAC.1
MSGPVMRDSWSPQTCTSNSRKRRANTTARPGHLKPCCFWPWGVLSSSDRTLKEATRTENRASSASSTCCS